MNEPMWYYWKEPNRVGPYSKAQLASLLSKGVILDSTPVWKVGSPDWVPLQQVLEISQSPQIASPTWQKKSVETAEQAQKSKITTLVIVLAALILIALIGTTVATYYTKLSEGIPYMAGFVGSAFLIPYLLMRWRAKNAYQRQRAVAVGLVIALIVGASDMVPKIDSGFESRESDAVMSQVRSQEELLNVIKAHPNNKLLQFSAKQIEIYSGAIPRFRELQNSISDPQLSDLGTLFETDAGTLASFKTRVETSYQSANNAANRVDEIFNDERDKMERAAKLILSSSSLAGIMQYENARCDGYITHSAAYFKAQGTVYEEMLKIVDFVQRVSGQYSYDKSQSKVSFSDTTNVAIFDQLTTDFKNAEVRASKEFEAFGEFEKQLGAGKRL